MHDDSVRAVAGFLADAARHDVSTHTVVQVLTQWVRDGVTRAELLAAVAAARSSSGRQHHGRIASFEHAILNDIPC